MPKKFPFRSVNCEVLLPVQKKQCSACASLRIAIKKRVKRLSSTDSPHIKMNNRFMNTPQTKKKLVKERKEKRNAAARALYHKRARELIEKEAVNVDERLSEDFTTILRGYQKLNKLQRIFFLEQMKAAQAKSARGVKWHPLLIRVALAVRMASPKAFKVLADCGILYLPSDRTLFDYTHHEIPKEGVSGPAIKDLVQLMASYDEKHSYQKYHVLLMDEMSISKNLVYSRASGELTGFLKLSELETEAATLDAALRVEGNLQNDNDDRVGEEEIEHELVRKAEGGFDENNNNIPDISGKILTYMVIGIASKVRQVVASFGTKDVTPEYLSRTTWDVIATLERADVRVLALTCDGHPVNRAFIQSHIPITKLKSGTVFDTWNLATERRILYFLSDVPHLLKTIRNCFYNSGFGKKTRRLKINGESISWLTILRLYEDEKNNEIRLAHKLNAQVVYLNSYSGMKVSYAAYVFSFTVARALAAMGYNNVNETARFIRKVNKFFDRLNGCSSKDAWRERNPDLAAYRSEDDERLGKLHKFLTYIQNWSAQSSDEYECLSRETITGIEMTIHAFEQCVKFMIREGGRFVMARIFCQDPLEQYFSKQRAACGGSTNPNLKTFLQNQSNFRLTKGLGFKKTKGNTENVLEDDNLLELCAPLPRRKKSTAVAKRVNVVRRAIASHSDFTFNDPIMTDNSESM